MAEDNGFMPNYCPSTPATGLLLSGGGARAAYQVGVLEAIAVIRKASGALNQPNPIPIITGMPMHKSCAVKSVNFSTGPMPHPRTVRPSPSVNGRLSAGSIRCAFVSIALSTRS